PRPTSASKRIPGSWDRRKRRIRVFLRTASVDFGHGRLKTAKYQRRIWLRNSLVRGCWGSSKNGSGALIFDDLAVVHEHDAVGDVPREAHLVRHDHHRHARPRPARSSCRALPYRRLRALLRSALARTPDMARPLVARRRRGDAAAGAESNLTVLQSTGQIQRRGLSGFGAVACSRTSRINRVQGTPRALALAFTASSSGTGRRMLRRAAFG